MVAAVLDLHIGAGAIAEALDQMPRSLLDRHDVVDRHALGAVDAEPGKGTRLELLLIADDVIDLVHRSEAGRIDLRGAAGDYDPGVRPLAARLTDRLPGLTHRLRRHRAGVDDHRVGQPRGARMRAHDFGLIGVQPAAESDDLDIPLLEHWRLLT